MNPLHRPHRTLHTVVSATLMLLLVACGGTPTTETNQTVTATPDELINAANDTNSSRSRTKKLMIATSLLLDSGDLDRAESTLAMVEFAELESAQQAQFLLLSLDLAQRQGNIEQMRQAAERAQHGAIFAQTPLPQQRLAIALLASTWEQLNQPLTAAAIRIAHTGIFAGDEYQQNIDKIWQLLSRAPLNDITLRLTTPLTDDEKGWLTLATVVRQNQRNLDDSLTALQQWQQQWPNHLANQQLPGELKLLSTLPQRRPKVIALALPLTGNLGAPAQAVREGFLAAYFADPYREQNGTSIRIVDTANQAFLDVHQKLVNDGADLVVGPLGKDDVAALAKVATLTIPTLALNQMPESDLPPVNLYQFALAAEDEATQIAEQGILEGKRRAVVLHTQSDWGERVYGAFEKRWLEGGGVILSKRSVRPKSDLKNSVMELLAVDQSISRTRDFHRIVGGKLESEVRRRQDIDVVFLAVEPSTARQLKPILGFYYAGDVPVYATSSIYSGTVSPKADKDLDGIRFLDMPWSLNRSNLLHQELAQQFGTLAARYDRLFAMGVDAYRLAPRLTLMERIPESRFDGETGVLSLNKRNELVRQLDWAAFENGRPTAISIGQTIPAETIP